MEFTFDNLEWQIVDHPSPLIYWEVYVGIDELTEN